VKRRLAFFSLLVLNAGLVVAQSAAEPVAGDEDSVATTSSRSGETAQTAGAEQPGVTTPGVTTPGVTTPGATTPGATTPGSPAEEPVAEAPEAGDNSPFDYQASEQISEDLSVSFPIDI
jgi:hypothetical protein